MKMILASVLSIGFTFCFGQRTNPPDELYGFRLGQYKSVVSNELGQPNKTKKLDDSVKVDFYFITKDSATYVAFQYNPEKPIEIYAIQLSGVKSDRPFYGLNLGESELKVTNIFGKPDSVFTQDFDGKKSQTWKYIHKNTSLLFADNQLKSIRIWDGELKKDYNYPTIDEILDVIKSGDKKKICNLLSPGLEIYYCDKIITWKNSFYKDVYVEKESVMDFITHDQYGLKSLSTIKNLKHVDNLRIVEGSGAFPVYKFPDNPLITELVLNYQQNNYKIWEIRYKCKKD